MRVSEFTAIVDGLPNNVDRPSGGRHLEWEDTWGSVTKYSDLRVLFAPKNNKERIMEIKILMHKNYFIEKTGQLGWVKDKLDRVFKLIAEATKGQS